MKRHARIFPLLTLLLASLLSGSGVWAQQKLQFEHLTEKQGLSQGTVICVFQDRMGFMWIGTQDGLNRYDGYEVKVFKNDPSDSTSLNDNFILQIAEDTSGVLWIGTLNTPDMLNRFDRASESFVQIPRESVDLTGMRVGSAFSEYVDPFGVRWLGTRGEGLQRVDPKTGKTITYTNDPSNPASLIDNRIYGVAGDQKGAIWVTTRSGLGRFDPRTEMFTHYQHDEANPNSPSDNFLWPILVDKSGVLWIGTWSGGLNRFDPESETFTHYKHNDSDPRSLAGDRLYSLFQDQSGMIWVGTGDNGADRFNPSLSTFGHYLHNPTEPASLIDNNIQSLFVDKSGIVWIGTRGGLDRWDRSRGSFTHYTHSAANPGSIAESLGPTIIEDRSGSLWIGTMNSGLSRFDKQTGRVTHYTHDPANPRSISDNRVYALQESRSGELWVGTYGGGLNRFDRASGSFTAYTHVDSVEGSLGAEGVWSLLEDRDGVLWVGTYGAGLDRFDRDSQTFAHFHHNDADAGSLSNDNVLSLFEDRSGTLWVGTMGGGLSRFDRETGSFRNYREKDGLANDMVFGILEDGLGNLWMSTNKGISRFDPRTETFWNFDYSDGLQGNEFNQGAYTQDPRTGEMFFGGSNGLNIFDPNTVRRNSYVPPVVFSSFTRYNTDDEEGRPIEEKGTSAQSEITISYKDNIAYFEFAALSYYNSFKNKYSYKLEGFSDNWIQLGTERRATFTDLDGGEYVLRVRGSNNDGVWNEEGASLRVIVTPPWWKTTWAYTGYGILIIAFLWGARRFEINQREQKAKMREAQLHAKAVEAEKKVLAAENERKTKELEDARTLQLSMLPKEVPKLPGYEIAVFMKTATEVGGDYYDFSLSKDGTLDVAFGDATGHGMQAGTVVTLMKGLFLLEASRTDIQTFFGQCTRAIKETKLGRLLMALTLVRIQGNSVSLSTAGMPPVYLHRKSNGLIEEILLKGMPLGAMKNFHYALHETILERGDTLLLLTDGLPEQKNSREEMFDYARVQSAFGDLIGHSPKEIIDELMQAGDSWMDGVVQDDDITLMVIRKTA